MELTFKLFSKKDLSSHLGERYHRQQFTSVSPNTTFTPPRPILGCLSKSWRVSSGNKTSANSTVLYENTRGVCFALLYLLPTESTYKHYYSSLKHQKNQKTPRTHSCSEPEGKGKQLWLRSSVYLKHIVLR